jgi:trimeric autotransporter adhesin
MEALSEGLAELPAMLYFFFIIKKFNMKTKCYLYIACHFLAGLFMQRANAQANTELSNLISLTKVNQSLLPITTNSKDLGSISASWGSIHLGGGLYLDGKRFLSNGNDPTNLFVGADAGNKRVTGKTGKYNTASGQYALYSYTTGISNTATGYTALYSNTTGTANTANGAAALYSNTTGKHNSATGFTALRNNKGSFNTADGSGALYSNTTGNYNTATGNLALYANTTGNNNTATGREALRYNTSGKLNTANGYRALYSNTTGNYNTATGHQALYNNSLGTYNTAIGYTAGSANGIILFCTFIGYDADQIPFTDCINSTALGSSSRITAGNQVRIGNSSVTSIGGYEPWTNLSDGRFKKNVKENVPGLAFINQLHPITYTMDVTSLRNFLGEDRKNEITTAEVEMVREKNPEAEALIQKGIQEKEKIIRTGFTAQQVEEAAKKIGYDFSGVDKPTNEHTPYGLRYSEFVVPLVKAVQELSKMSEGLRADNDELKSEVRNLKSEIDKLKSAVLSGNSFGTSLSDASLAQNVPNPFVNTTTITYSLPSKLISAQIIITDGNGKQLKQLNISGGGNGTLHLDASTLSSGTYTYSLIIDGKIITTKQMVIAK